MEKRADARANKVRVTNAARAVFAEKGMTAEMKEIAERAGVGVGTIYRNFPTKDDLVSEIIREVIDEMREGVDEAELEEDPVVGLRTALTRLFAVVDRHGWLVDAVLGGQVSPKADEAEIDPTDPRNRGIERLIQRAIERGSFRDDLDVELATAFLQGAMGSWVHGTIRTGRSGEQAAAEAVDLLVRGAAKGSA